MDCSVIICTRNRSAQLKRVLASIADLEIPPGIFWELVLVDNGSTDDTAAAVQEFMGVLPLIYVSEPAAGLSNARNAGVAASRGAYLVWTDDDVLLDRRWLASYLMAFSKHPEAAVFGGKITPVVEPPTPSWFTEAVDDLGFLLAKRDLGDAPVMLSEDGDRLPYGASFAIRRDEQLRHLFDPHLGVAPGRRRGGEETDAIAAILRDGYTGWWVPDAKVDHIIPSTRQTMAYVIHFYEAMGEASAFIQLKGERPSPRLALIETSAKLGLCILRYLLAASFRRKRLVRYRTSVAFHHGRLKFFTAARTD